MYTNFEDAANSEGAYEYQGDAQRRQLDSLSAVYVCKICARPVEHAIEGELICNACWQDGEKTRAERDLDAEIAKWELWSQTHCPACGEPQAQGALCRECEDLEHQLRFHADSAYPVGFEVGPDDFEG